MGGAGEFFSGDTDEEFEGAARSAEGGSGLK